MYCSSSCRTDQQNLQSNNFNKNKTKKHVSVPKLKVSKNKKCSYCPSFSFFPFFFFFFNHIFWFFFSLFFLFFIKFFSNSHWFGLYIFFFQSLSCFFFSLSGQFLIICLLHFSIAYEYPSFLSSFFLALKYPGCSFLNHPNFYSFSQQNFPLKTIQNPRPQIFCYT